MKCKANADIREAAKRNNVCLWQIAEKLGLVDSNFSKSLRREMSENEKTAIFKIIDELAKEAKE